MRSWQAAGKHSKVKIIIGGIPAIEDFARGIGANGYASGASQGHQSG